MSGLDFANAVRAEAARIANDHQGVHLAAVIGTGPLELELMDSRHVLGEDQFTLSQWVKRYDGVDGIDEGDVVTLIRKKRNGEVVWIVTDVISEKTPS